MNYTPMNIAPNAQFASPADISKQQPLMFSFPTPRSQFTIPTSPPWDNCDYSQQQPQMVQVVLPFAPQMCYSPHPVYPMAPMHDQVSLSATMPDPLSTMHATQSVSLSAMTPEQSLPQMTTSTPQAQSPANVPMFLFPTQYTQHPMQQFPAMPMPTMPDQNQFFGRSSTSVSPPPTMMDHTAAQRNNKRSPPGFDKNNTFKQSPSPKRSERKPLAARVENETSNPRRRNSKRKSKKQQEKLSPGEYRPSYRSKQDMIDKVFLALSQKYTALGLLENKGLRGDDTIRVHVKNFNALTRIEEALIAVESHPEVKVSRVSLPFSFRNEYQKKGFLVYLKLEDVTMVPHAQSVFRQYDEFKKCGVMRETGQYVESLPLAQATTPSDSVSDKQTEWDSTSCDSGKESTPDYASSTESASSTDLAESDSEQLEKQPAVISNSFGPLTALASTRQQMLPQLANATKVDALMRVARRTQNNDQTAGCSGLERDCANLSFVNLQKLTCGEAGL